MRPNILKQRNEGLEIVKSEGTGLIGAYLKGEDLAGYVERLKKLDYNVLRLGRYNKYKWLLKQLTEDLPDDETLRSKYQTDKTLEALKQELLPICKDIVA